MDTYVHFAARRFRWSIPDIRNTWDNEFFAVIRLEEEAIEREKKELDKSNKGHTGGKTYNPNSGSHKQYYPEIELEDDPAMMDLYDQLMSRE